METRELLIVDVARLTQNEKLVGETGPGILDLGSKEEIITPVGGIKVDLQLTLLGTELLVRGKLEQKIRCLCNRCAVPFETTVAENSFYALHELVAEDEFIDLTPDVREAIILALPGYPVCRSTCRGLCPKCGHDLNKGMCKCKPDVPETWSALDQLKL